MGPLMDDLAVVENGDLVAELARGETVADVNRCPVAGNLVEFLIDFCLCNGVKSRSWFIQNDEGGHPYRHMLLLILAFVTSYQSE